MKKGLIILIVVVVVIVAGMLVLKSLGGNPDEVIIENTNVTDVKDGTYQGEYETTLVSATIDVTVAGGIITDIAIVSQNCGPGHSASEITSCIIDAQSLDVDTISSSTMSSKVILKSVELALAKGR